MLHVHIPDAEDLRLEHLVMDVNGTLSDRGALIDGVAEPLRRPTALPVLSADTFGTAEALAAGLRAELRRVHTGADERAYSRTSARDAAWRSATAPTTSRCSGRPHLLSPQALTATLRS